MQTSENKLLEGRSPNSRLERIQTQGQTVTNTKPNIQSMADFLCHVFTFLLIV